MRVMSVWRLSAWVLIATCATAAAGTRTAVVFHQGTGTCEHATETVDGDQGILEISLVDGEPAKAAAAKKDIAVRAVGADGKELAAATIKAKAGKLDAAPAFAASVT